MGTHKRLMHQPDCPTQEKSLRGQVARGEYTLHSITAGQPGCPFCEMQEEETSEMHPGLKQLLERSKRTE